MKYIKLIILVLIVFLCTGCKMTCVKIEHNENTDNILRVIIRENDIELSNSYSLNDTGKEADNKDELLETIKDYVDSTYNTFSSIENDTVNMNLIVNKDNDIFGKDLSDYNYFELSKFFKEKGYTCR